MNKSIKHIRDILKKLPKVKASDDFVKKLEEKIKKITQKQRKVK